MLFARGRRLFSSACLTTILVAILHTIGNTAPGNDPPDMLAVFTAMQGYDVPSASAWRRRSGTSSADWCSR